MVNFLNIIGKFVVGVLVDLFAALLLKFYWIWFIMPIFPIKEITVLQALGLIFVTSLFTMRVSSAKDEPDFTTVIIGRIIYIIFFFIFGGILSFFL